MERYPKISVVIPAFNAELYIGETLSSALAQTYPSFEVIVVDDGSTDGTRDIVRSFGSSVVLVEQKNSGVSSARNQGVAVSNGEFIAFLDADDLWYPDKLERQIEELLKVDGEWAYSDVKFHGGVNDSRKDSEFTEKFSGHVLENLAEGNFIGTSSVIIRKRLFWTAGGFDESLPYVEDWDLWARVALRAPIVYLEDVTTVYRVHLGSTSRSVRKTFNYYLKVVDRVHEMCAGGSVINATNGKISKAKAKSNACLVCSYIAEEEGDPQFAWYCAIRAVRYTKVNVAALERCIKCFLKILIKQRKNNKSSET